jgi:hypothetical protein
MLVDFGRAARTLLFRIIYTLVIAPCPSPSLCHSLPVRLMIFVQRKSLNSNLGEIREPVLVKTDRVNKASLVLIVQNTSEIGKSGDNDRSFLV